MSEESKKQIQKRHDFAIEPKKKIGKLKAFTEYDSVFSNTFWLSGIPLEKTSELIYRKVFDGRVHVVKADPEHGLPYGSIPRLIQIYIDTQITLSKEGKGDIQFQNGIPVIFLSKTLSGIAEILELGTDGNTLKRIKEQFNKYARINITIETTDPKTGITEENVMDMFYNKLFLWEEKKKTLENSYLEINPRYFEYVSKHDQPLLPQVLRKIKRSPSNIDCYRNIMFRVNTPFYRTINLGNLAELVDCELNKDFTKKIIRLLKIIKEVHFEELGQVIDVNVIPGKNQYETPQLEYNSKKRKIINVEQG